MTIDAIRKHLSELPYEITFNYNGRLCGADPFGAYSIDIWYGEKEVETVDSVEKALTIPLFDGKSLTEILDDCTDFEGC